MATVRVYCFELRDEHDAVIMSTEIDNEPNPAADAEFWARFLQGDCIMEYTGNVEEEIEE
jgi:hypothetical protein